MAKITPEERTRQRQERGGSQARKEVVREARYAQGYRRHRAWEALEDRLRDLVPRALDVLERALDENADPKQAVPVALAVLRAGGLQGLERPAEPNRALLAYEEVDPDLEETGGDGREGRPETGL